MKRDSLKIEIAGATANAVPFESFLKVADGALALLEGIDKVMSGGSCRVAWRVTAISMNSPIEIVVTGKSDADATAVGKRLRAYAEGIGQLEESPQVPDYFDDSLLREVKSIASVLHDGVSRVTFTIGRRAVSPTIKTTRHINALMRQVIEDATFEGTLETVSIRGQPRFSLFDPLTEGSIECRFKRADLGRVKSYLTEDATRVIVSGSARYTRTGTPISIDIERVESLPEECDLPQIQELAGIDITGGMAAADYVKRFNENR